MEDTKFSNGRISELLGAERGNFVGDPFFRAVVCELGIDSALKSAANADLISRIA